MRVQHCIPVPEREDVAPWLTAEVIGKPTQAGLLGVELREQFRSPLHFRDKGPPAGLRLLEGRKGRGLLLLMFPYPLPQVVEKSLLVRLLVALAGRLELGRVRF